MGSIETAILVIFILGAIAAAVIGVSVG